ncbi:hypothetical protein [Evansella cellulosilytica]|uniref:Uncharacterized protein n=1 Tax=Evansella cellulosilytica (strain ATCC 21833 / DSM 2522 / FERM P-1141 / JCM 9156 / N-4) TaxID=649639 RepID=E6TTY4_EVAC2|nr:hypothetical protein [Evansella cellulosilytica]ADU32015.1 hypothetical protein Bcell_3775 [Evansella cellulosilytica DSM 2522]
MKKSSNCFTRSIWSKKITLSIAFILFTVLVIGCSSTEEEPSSRESLEDLEAEIDYLHSLQEIMDELHIKLNQSHVTDDTVVLRVPGNEEKLRETSQSIRDLSHRLDALNPPSEYTRVQRAYEKAFPYYIDSVSHLIVYAAGGSVTELSNYRHNFEEGEKHVDEATALISRMLEEVN